MPTPSRPEAPGLHGPFIQQQLPAWLWHATPADLDRLGRSLFVDPSFLAGNANWFNQAPAGEREAFLAYLHRSRRTAAMLARALKGLQSVSGFCEPLLRKRMADDLKIKPDLHRTQFVEVRYQSVVFGAMRQLVPRQQSLLQAALQNFAADCEFEAGTALAPEGAFTLELVPGTEGGAPRFRYRFLDRLAIEPTRFARLCHDLDLGGRYQRHLTEVFETPTTRAGIRAASVATFKAQFRVHIQLALMKKDIEESVRQTLLELLESPQRPLYRGRRVRVSRLKMFTAQLFEPLFIRSEGDSGKALCLLYLPGAPRQPLKQYATVEALHADLLHKLRFGEYRALLRRFVLQADQAHVFTRLEAALYHLVKDPNGIYEQRPDPDGKLYLREVPIHGELFGLLQDQHLSKLKQDARFLAVPSADVDEQARERRLAYWEDIGLNVLNTLAFMVPAVGAVMLLVTAVQLLDDVVEGVHAWENGEIDELWAHLRSIGLNVALMIGFGVAGRAAEPMLACELVDGLVKVRLPNGNFRLWKPSLGNYASDVDLGAAVADSQGVYWRGTSSYVRIDGRTFEVHRDEAGGWSLGHPEFAEAYRPALRHNGQGAWRLRDESPLDWSRQQLLRRIGPLAEGVTDELLEAAAQISGCGDDLLREMHLHGRRVPPLLRDTLERLRLEQRLDNALNDLRNGHPLRAEVTLGARLAVTLPGWPQRLLAVSPGALAEGPPRVFGHPSWAVRPAIPVSLRQLTDNRLAEAILAALDEPAVQRLLGSQVPASARAQVLREQLAELGGRQRSSLLDQLHGAATPTQPADVQRLQSMFPRLSAEAAQELLGQVPRSEREELAQGLAGPSLRLAEAARLCQRQIRLGRAIEGLYAPGLESQDSACLAFGLLERLPGWPQAFSLELRELTLEGPLLQRLGPSSGPSSTVLRIGQRYRVYDAEGQELASERSIYDAILQALPESAGSALGMARDASQALRVALYRQALAARGQAANLLGLQPVRPWFRSPLQLADGRNGYPLGGVGSTLSGSNRRLRNLFPTLDAQALVALRESLLLRYARLGDAIAALEEAWLELDEDLQSWIERGVDAIERDSRRTLAARVLQAWRRRSGEGSQLLDLSDIQVSELPSLQTRFEHIHDLRLNNMQLAEVPVGFLHQFDQVQVLRLASNWLSEVPQAVCWMRRLRVLDLQNNRLLHRPAMFETLRLLRHLRSLDLADNTLMSLPGEALQTLLMMPGLRRLNLSGNYLTLETGALELLSELSLESLELADNLIRLDPPRAALFARYGQLQRLDLSGNPLGLAPQVDGLRALERLNLERCLLRDWPSGVTALMEHSERLRIVDLSSNGITQLPELGTTRFAQQLLADETASYRLLLDQNPLDAAAFGQLQRLRTHPRREGRGMLLTTWLLGASQARRNLWNGLFHGRSNRALKDMLERMLLSQDIQRRPEAVSERIWALLEAATAHTQLREELLAIAEGFPVTCGDAGAEAFSELELASLAFQQGLVAADVGARHSGLLTFYKKLYRRAQVQRLADRIILQRSLRRHALLEQRLPLPALDPLDDIPDRILSRFSVDDIEIRLAMRQDLAPRLDFPEPSSGMLYREIAQVSPATLARVKNAVLKSETERNRRAWMVTTPGWQRYLKQRFAAQFQVISEFWAEGLDYLDDCLGMGEPSVTRLDRSVRELLSGALHEDVLDSSGRLRHPTLDNQRYLHAVNALQQAHEKAEEDLMLSLTRVEELAG
ncbi:hypothetical protein DCO48_08190 [Pseudomonas sp. SDI]|uniref:NEL-type E3 ubiquitin ligase domain-containing protein n=1 Tax=Pseudomonas sp. SDI TaxID=2170734 RepID=UPI000DE7199B|nr:DUF6543 domain-containing protein [Pseudomonas sp. SDI]PWB33949.1 hypothetical protein DCO48_08190 [Pseudomonas sp. SDI]